MDTRQLAAFCAVVERRSFSQAAERLGVTQPAVSLQVRALEKRLGTQLLDRSGRRVEPTEAGMRLYRGVAFEPFFHDPVVLVCPPGHRFAGKSVSLDQLRDGNLIAMQEGAGVRQLLEDELRRGGKRLRDLGVRLELGLQESVLSAVRAGHGVTFISRRSVEADLAAGTLAEARVEGLELERDVFLVRATGRVETRAARAFLDFAHDKL